MNRACHNSCGNSGCDNQHRSYGYLFNTQQVYTVSRFPPWKNVVGYDNFGLDAPSGDFRTYPLQSWHPLAVGVGLGYGPVLSTNLDQRNGSVRACRYQ